MIRKQILNPQRLRRIDGGFSFIPHRFLSDGFVAALSQQALLLYLFLVLVSDRHGLSFYAYDRICTLCRFTLEEYLQAREELLEKDLIAFAEGCFQVLDLPPAPVHRSREKRPVAHPQPVRLLIEQSLQEVCHAG